MADYSITAHDPRDLSDEELLEGLEMNNQFTAEVLPDDPPTPPEVFLAAHHARPERLRRWAFRARAADGTLIGSAGAGIDPENDSNPDLLFFSIGVLAPHRRNGVGTKLFAEMVQLAEKESRNRLVSTTIERIPAGDEFAKAVGAEAKQAMHLNHLPVAEVDRALMERWVAEGPTRAADYEMISWDGACPDEYLEQWVEAVLVMNTAPRDDLEMNDFTLTPEEVREHEKIEAAAGTVDWVVVVRHKETGQFAGHHNVTWNPADPKTVWVGMTAVRPEHRGHAIGKWLKAAMTLRILDERPDVDDIRTGNADSNDAMLGINREMGYRPMIAQTTWEISTEAARAWLESKGAL